MKLSFQKNKFVLYTDDISSVDLTQWKMGAGHWTTRKLKEAARFEQHADDFAKRIFRKLALKRMALPPGGFHDIDSGTFLPGPLMKFQRERGIPFILKQNRTYLAHQPGLGKSAQFITAVSVKPGPALIICPNFLKRTWAREITKWFIYDFPHIQVVPESARASEMDWGADFVICSDSMLAKDWVMDSILKAKFRFIAVDEAHRFKNPEAARTVALFGGRQKGLLSKGLIYNSEHVTFLSGTPLLSRPIELWTVLYAAAPEVIDFMSYADFGFHFCGPTQNDRGQYLFLGAHNEDELNERIMGTFMQRITKAEVLPDLPSKIREVIYVDDNREREVVELDHELTQMFETSFTKPKALGEWATLRHINGLAKTRWAAQFVDQILSEDDSESIILYAYHRDVVADLAGLLIKYRPMVIIGGVAEEKRTNFEDLFQSGKRRLIIGNLRAMNLGITLTRATRVVFVEYSETPSENEQGEDRANRIGSKWSVFCQYLVLPNSLDEIYLNMLLKKQKTIKKVIDA